MANLFRTSLFGYSKASVNDYISKCSEEFARKLLEKDREHKGELEALQAELERLTQENEKLQATRQEVADALISAKDYAAELKQQAEADDQTQRAINTARQEAETSRLQSVAEKIDGLHRAFRDTLKCMDRELTLYTEEVQRLRTVTERQTDIMEQANFQKEGEIWVKKDGQES